MNKDVLLMGVGSPTGAMILCGAFMWWFENGLDIEAITLLFALWVVLCVFLTGLFSHAVAQGRRERKQRNIALNDAWHEKASEDF